MAKVYLHGTGHFHPENIIDNKFLQDLDIGVDPDWITERVGINQRRTVLDLDYIKHNKNQDPREAFAAAKYSNAETGALAAKHALQQTKINPTQIGLILTGGCSPDISTPAESCTIANQLNIEAPAIDLNSACSTFGAQMHFLTRMQPELSPDYILLVIPENNTKAINYADRKTAVLWGDGSFAAVVSLTIPSNIVISNTSLNSDPKNWRKVQIPNKIQHFQQEGNAVQTFAIKKTTECFKSKTETNSCYFIGHQANLSMLRSVCKRCDIADDRHLYNVDNYGNTGAAGAPIVLSQNLKKFISGDSIALIVVGAGLTWSYMNINFL